VESQGIAVAVAAEKNPDVAMLVQKTTIEAAKYEAESAVGVRTDHNRG